MGRYPKKGLPFWKKPTDYYSDIRIMNLLAEYGPLGNTIFDCIVCMINREGYYLEIPLENLATVLIRIVGVKWAKNKNLVLRVIDSCADSGLLCKGLLAQNIITSVDIQRGYAEVTSRNKVDKSLYWLIDENGQPLKSVPTENISVTEMPINDAEIPIFAEEIPIREKKEEGRKKKVDIKKCPPSLDDVRGYCKEHGIDPERFHSYYAARGWLSAGGQPVTDWEAKVRYWTSGQKHTAPTTREPTYDITVMESLNVFDIKEREK